jgi:hypothetical protein
VSQLHAQALAASARLLHEHFGDPTADAARRTTMEPA